ncbi:GNAT family N-acetyltransferase [Pseudonocardiaceae bacterium YIM PH 21723]|nr:GNAT family N-acetyltransferase [Pseudonocardiaceae bacterium YIM PH 21723]
MSFRFEVRITPTDIGKRVSVRSLLPDGRFTDAVGTLDSWTDGELLITRKSGEQVTVSESALVAGKVVPAAPVRHRTPAVDIPELARVAANSWQAAETEQLGDWLLRAAGGFTRRANSAFALGDPGLPVEQALDRVRDWYAAREQPAYVQAIEPALLTELDRLGWEREITTEVRVGALAPLADRPGDGVELSRTLTDEWLRHYNRTGAGARQVLTSGPSVWFASVPGKAIGRCVIDGRWAGFMAIEVAPEHRRQGLATTIMAALAQQALTERASAAWLSVETDNDAARPLYDRLGVTAHHVYHHYRAQS